MSASNDEDPLWIRFVAALGVPFEKLDVDSDWKAILATMPFTPIERGVLLKIIRDKLQPNKVAFGMGQ